MKKITVFILSICFATLLFAQNENDALRYSMINYGGTARFSALSGAYGAVGADFTSLSQNPAGIGLFRKSEFVITPVFASNNTTSRYLGNQLTDNRNTGYLGNIGFVITQDMKGAAGPLQYLQFGFGVNMLAMFSNRMTLTGFNTENSLLNTYVDDVNENNLPLSEWDDFGAGLAYDVNLIYWDSISPTNQRWAADMENGHIQQTKYVETEGSTNETVISAGANISDKFYLGMTFAFPFIRYRENSRYTEEDKENLNSYYNSFDRYEYLETRGNGFNFKVGFIFKPVESLRIGGSIHTPTNYYNMTDNYSASMNSYFRDGENYSKQSPAGFYDYELKTPFRATGSLAFIIGKYGLISADYEYIDYSDSHLWAYDYSFSNENEAIRTQYTSSNNLRFGAEIKAGIAVFRGGYSLYGSPYAGADPKGARTGFSFGTGIRSNGYYADFSYNHTTTESYYYLYNTAPSSLNTVNTNAYSLTIGMRF